MKQRIGRAPWDKKQDAPPKKQPQPPAKTRPSSSSSSSPAAPPSYSQPKSPALPKALAPDLCVYGRHAVDATLRFQAQRCELLYHTDNRDLAPIVELATRSGVKTRLVEHAVTDALAGGRDVAVAQGIVLACLPFPFADVEDFEKAPSLTLVLDGVEDPRNLGAAVRAAYALGAGLVVIPADRAATATASAIKASAGALCRIPLARATNLRRALELLKEKGAWIVGAEADGDASPWSVDMSGPTVVVIGGEDRGLRRLTREACDHVVSIPMAAKDMSLNAADAATLLLYEALRQRRQPKTPAVSGKPAAKPA
ncbi:MAG: 23S rRNA (guanosine(2251)-2'-O)-methyltransferase RlmB [Deltaproteobacteria bacterium]|nr:23S rRNA (guanosine(2251)-2'-O)-methyltransferase RlmB [Deltaproteobacteria bacterium]